VTESPYSFVSYLCCKVPYSLECKVGFIS